MSSIYAKGVRVWLPETNTGWVPGTVTSLSLSGDDPNTECTLVITLDASDTTRTLKFPLSALRAVEAGVISVAPVSAAPGQEAPPPLRNPPLLESSEDLASLSNLNEPSGECLYGSTENAES